MPNSSSTRKKSTGRASLVKASSPRRAKAKPVSKAPANSKVQANSRNKNVAPLSPKRVDELLKRLDLHYLNSKCALLHNSAWELLVATILSAQCTDERVNMVTPGLFARYPTPQALAALEPEELEPQIRSTGFFRNKSKSVVGAARMLVNEFNGQVPDDMDKLLSMPGVARKTANVVLGSWFGISAGVVVDTHVYRISRRLELTKSDTPEKIELDLMKIVPKEKWTDFSHQIIWHGRRICVARKPRCAECPLENLCHAADKTWSTVDIHKSAKP